MAQPIYVTALGASTAVGRDAWASAAAVRAGLSGFTEHEDLFDAVGQPMRLAIAPWLDVETEGVDRFEALLLPAIAQALESLTAAGDPNIRVALALALPAPRPGLPSDLDAGLRNAVSEHGFSAVATFPLGHAAGFAALRAATMKIEAQAFDACVIAGVDSYLSRRTLKWLEHSEQLHGAGPLNNAWGFIPGEAACAVLLVAESTVARLRLDPLGRVLSVGTAFEPNGMRTKRVCTGEGLTAAFRAGLVGLPRGARVTDVYCDMNGEPFRGDEFGFAYLRTKAAFESGSDFVAAADCWGDVSAASAPLAVMLALIAGRKSYSNGPYAFVWSSSEGGERGSALLTLDLQARGQ